MSLKSGKCSLGYAAAIASMACLFQPGPTNASPNLILVLADDLGWSSFSTSMDTARPNAKSDFYETPNLDRLARMGMRFSNGYAAAPVCSPTRYSIQFGKTPARLLRTRSERPNRVDHEQKSIAQVLKTIDPTYRAAHLGKWHIDFDPARLGYDVHDGITNNGTGGFVDDRRQWEGEAKPDPKRIDSLTRRAIDFIEDSKARGQPFFLQISHYAVHSNIEYSAESLALFADREKGVVHSNSGYAAMLYDLDESISELLRAYEELELNEDTYLIFVSDNGGMPSIPMQLNLGRPYPQILNSPLLRGKWDLTEGGLRVPFMIVGPDVAPGSQSDIPVVTYDLLPTLAELAGSEIELPEDLDGGSFRGLLSDPEANVSRPFDGLIFHYPHYNRVGMNEPHSAIRLADYKLIHFPISQRSLLFDLNRDIAEQVDLSQREPETRAKLEKALAEYLRSVGAERPQQGGKWSTVGKEGTVRTELFQQYPKDAAGESADETSFHANPPN